jgi:cob(I)alamin adenosyltransferase
LKEDLARSTLFLSKEEVLIQKTKSLISFLTAALDHLKHEAQIVSMREYQKMRYELVEELQRMERIKERSYFYKQQIVDLTERIDRQRLLISTLKSKVLEFKRDR